MIYLEKTDVAATLTTWIYCTFWQMWAAEQQGKDVYINWPDGHTPPRALLPYHDSDKFAQMPNMFEWYFTQPKIKEAQPATEIWTWENWQDSSPVPFMAQPLDVIKAYYKKHLHFNDVVNQRGQKIVEKYNIDFSKTIGITWRGTDNVTDGRPRMPIQTYFKYIDLALEATPDARIMCTAEEETILQPLLDRYPQAFNIDEFHSSPLGSLDNPERHIPISGFERGMQPALMVWLFSKCLWYIKNRSSTGAVASWLSEGIIVNLGHPENLGYEKMDDQVEIAGERYPL